MHVLFLEIYRGGLSHAKSVVVSKHGSYYCCRPCFPHTILMFSNREGIPYPSYEDVLSSSIGCVLSKVSSPLQIVNSLSLRWSWRGKDPSLILYQGRKDYTLVSVQYYRWKGLINNITCLFLSLFLSRLHV